MERVKRLAGNEIELGIGIPTIESRASNIAMTKGTNVCCYAVCRNQYEHPGSSIVYLSETCLGHVYIVLEPVGSVCLTFR